MKSAPTDSRYIPLTQQPYCCVPTCIQIVMLRHRIPLVSQEELGTHLGLVVPKRDAHLFWKPKVPNRPPKSGYGTQNYEDKFANNAFKKLKVPLKMKFNLINNFGSLDDFKKYLAHVDKEDMDVLVCFNYRKLFDTRSGHGHVCVLDKVYPGKGEVRLIDPEAYVPKYRTVKIFKLYDSMKFHGNKHSGGFWEIIKA